MTELTELSLQEAGLYIHIPFCISKCPYCGFISFPASIDVKKAYVQALKKEIELYAATETGQGLVFNTLYFGGGTPSCLPVADLEELLKTAFTYFKWSDHVKEVTVEINPETVDLLYLKTLKQIGVTRVSIGLQALREEGLFALGRRHSLSQGLRAVEQAQSVGFFSLSIDLIYGWPGQDKAGWEEDLLQIGNILRPHHLSCYELTIEKDTPFQELLKRGDLMLPDEHVVLELWDMVAQILAPMGYRHYEISNYALEGKMCMHNLKYWTGAPYLGLGLGAASFVSGVRWRNTTWLDDYMSLLLRGRLPVSFRERLSRQQAFREQIVFHLRLIEGIDTRTFWQRWGIDPLEYYASELSELVDSGLVHIEKHRIRLTQKGLHLCNQVLARLV